MYWERWILPLHQGITFKWHITWINDIITNKKIQWSKKHYKVTESWLKCWKSNHICLYQFSGWTNHIFFLPFRTRRSFVRWGKLSIGFLDEEMCIHVEPTKKTRKKNKSSRVEWEGHGPWLDTKFNGRRCKASHRFWVRVVAFLSFSTRPISFSFRPRPRPVTGTGDCRKSGEESLMKG